MMNQDEILKQTNTAIAAIERARLAVSDDENNMTKDQKKMIKAFTRVLSCMLDISEALERHFEV